MGRVRFRGRDMVMITFSDWNVVPGPTKYVDPAKSGRSASTMYGCFEEEMGRGMKIVHVPAIFP